MPEVDCTNYTCQRPVGVAGLISPWNLPLYLLTFKLAPALAAGCTVVCKPSEMTSMTAYMFAKVMNEVGMYIPPLSLSLFPPSCILPPSLSQICFEKICTLRCKVN